MNHSAMSTCAPSAFPRGKSEADKLVVCRSALKICAPSWSTLSTASRSWIESKSALIAVTSALYHCVICLQHKLDELPEQRGESWDSQKLRIASLYDRAMADTAVRSRS